MSIRVKFTNNPYLLLTAVTICLMLMQDKCYIESISSNLIDIELFYDKFIVTIRSSNKSKSIHKSFETNKIEKQVQYSLCTPSYIHVVKNISKESSNDVYQVVTIVYSESDVIDISLLNESLFGYYIQMIWQNQVVYQSAFLQPFTPLTTNTSSAQDKYLEFSMSLSSAVTNCDKELIMKLLIALIDEYNNISLKRITFRSKDIIILLLNVTQRALTEPMISNDSNAWVNGNSRQSNKSKVHGNQFKYLAFERLRVVDRILEYFLSLLFSCECISEKSFLITGSSPLHVTSWLHLLSVDMYNSLSESQGEPVHDYTVKSEELSIIIRESINYHHSIKSTDCLVVNNNSQSQSFAQSLLNPVDEKIRALVQSNYEDDESLVELRQAIQDKQFLLLNHMFFLSVPVPDAEKQLSCFINVGDNYVKLDNYHSHLERSQYRLSTVVDDVLSDPNIVNYLTEKSDLLCRSISTRPNGSISAISPSGSTSAIIHYDNDFNYQTIRPSPKVNENQSTWSICDLMTRQVMMFRLSQMLLQLVKDSSVVRDDLKSDAHSYFLYIYVAMKSVWSTTNDNVNDVLSLNNKHRFGFNNWTNILIVLTDEMIREIIEIVGSLTDLSIDHTTEFISTEPVNSVDEKINDLVLETLISTASNYNRVAESDDSLPLPTYTNSPTKSLYRNRL